MNRPLPAADSWLHAPFADFLHLRGALIDRYPIHADPTPLFARP